MRPDVDDRQEDDGSAARSAARSGVDQPNLIPPADVPRLSVRMWLLVAAVGVVTGLAGAALMEVLHLTSHLTYGYHSGPFLAAVERSDPERRVVALAVAGAIAGLGWWCLRRRFGSGGTEVSAALWRREGRMPLIPTLATGLLSIVIVGMGASLGREGAPRQWGAALAGRFSDWAGMTSAHRRLLAACGAGAGMACVYNVPLGGALLTLEVMLGTFSLRLVLPAVASSCIATAVAWVALPNAPSYQVGQLHGSASLIVFAVLLGPIAGLAATGYTRLIAIAHRNRPQGRGLLVAPLLIFTVVGVLAIPYPQLLGNGKGIVQLTMDATLAAPMAAALLVLKPLATTASLGSGASGGLFTPTLATGAVLGTLLGDGWSHLWPASAMGYALIGAAAMLAAAMQAPIAAVVLILELTRNIDGLMVPLLFAVTGATLMSRYLNSPSIYSVRLPAQ
ncbi:chloride channel protein [Actinoallomurus rhizosphaericola]|uniref:chloride channel protein n=1 Tax=Actinoallomurus rhizosphaericola TaxID=2952536 RepID=UPI002091160E|nr:chloride channel protein [Actinoallomurus rhizosphaericola]MCO5993317.1 chloride channel protein [Actinoallomurus rhizosphaericola]